MKVGILGTGDVGQALGKAFVTLGHTVKMGSRSANNEKAQAWAKQTGPNASVGTFHDAAEFADLVVLATLGSATESLLKDAGPQNFRGKIVIDATNPLDFSGGMPPKLFVGHNDSLGEHVQRTLPEAKVVKAFNTVGNALMFRPKFKDAGIADMFICGNDKEAKKNVESLLKEFGWNTIDLGGIESSRYLEPMCMVWVLAALSTNTWNHAFKLVRT